MTVSYTHLDVYKRQSYVFVYESKLADMMERVDAGENPQGPQTSGQDTSGASTAGDILGSATSDGENEAE